jgi:hypothetical protein
MVRAAITLSGGDALKAMSDPVSRSDLYNLVFVGLPGPVMKQDVGARDGGAGTQEYGKEEEGDQPALHDHSIPCRSSVGQSSESPAVVSGVDCNRLIGSTASANL